MEIKKTQLLRDDPATADEFGSHEKIANLISREILDSNEGRSIAVVGDWGSGKSTIIELLKSEFINRPVHAFVYDAWSHQGDSLRRAFLDDLINSLAAHLSEDQKNLLSDQIWNRTETTETTKEPVLRPHAKILLICVALVPFGVKLFDLPSATSTWLEGLSTARNLTSYFFMLAPVIGALIMGALNISVLTGVRKFLFGKNWNDPNFSVLNFFFEKVQGQVERKYIKTPIDSIIAFQSVFNQTLEFVHSSQPDLRMVIVIDNIDRIPPDQARDFWSTMQTFFNNGGIRRPKAQRYWLVAPFSTQAVSFIFSNSIDQVDGNSSELAATAGARGYIDKTFSLSFYVPPPILTDWRGYLLGKLKESFPEHEDSDRVPIADLFDFARSRKIITPREMKLFVNGVVALYRQRGDEISLPTLAAYVLHRNEILDAEFHESLLSPPEVRVIDEADWRVPFAALRFGVNLKNAEQLVLAPEMRQAIREGNKNNLEQLENRVGFAAVLRKVIDEEMELSDTKNGVILSKIVAAVGALKKAGDSELSGVWTEFKRRYRLVERWEGFDESTPEGIKAVINYSFGPGKRDVCQILAESLAKAKIVEPESGFAVNDPACASWLACASSIAESIEIAQTPTLKFPSGGKLKLELIQQLTESNLPAELKARFNANASSDEIGSVLSAEIAAGRPPRNAASFISMLVNDLALPLQWPTIAKACTTKLSVADLNSIETQSLTQLLLAIRFIGGSTDALERMKAIAVRGNLSNLMHRHRKDALAKASLLAAAILANPSFQREGHIEQSEAGDNDYNAVLDAVNFDQAEIERIAKIILDVGAAVFLFDTGSQHAKIARISASILNWLVRSSYNFDLDPQLILDRKSFIEQQALLNPPASFFAQLLKKSELLSLLSSRDFQVEMSLIYRSAIDLVDGNDSENYLDYLQKEIASLDREQWDKSLEATNGMHLELLNLASDLRNRRHQFELTTAARDAVLNCIRKYSRGEIEASGQILKRVEKLLALLPNSLPILIRDVIDDMMAQTEIEQLNRYIEVVGKDIEFDSNVNWERIVRRIFTPIVNDPTENSVEWMAQVIEKTPDLLCNLPIEAKDEFELRLKTAINSANDKDSAISVSLNRAANLLNIDILSVDESSAEDTQSDARIESQSG